MLAYRIDDLDRSILTELARNGRLTNTELAERIPLSHSAISRRIAKLERDGAIQGYGALVDPSALGMTIRAFIGVRRDPSASVTDLSRGLKSILEVAGCWIVTGEYDFFLDVRARDMDAFSNVLLHHVQKVPGVVATVSTFVLADLQVTSDVT